MTTTPLRTRSLLAAAAAAAALLTAGCAGGSDDRGASGSAEPASMMDAGASAAPEGVADRAASMDDAGALKNKGAETDSVEPAVISTGTVSLEADDVAAARSEVQEITDHAGGAVTEEETTTDDDGDLATARMVLRVPSAKFDATTDALEEVGTLEKSTSGSEDVTTEVLDVEARIRAQEKSVRRIEALLARADTLDEVIAIEADLSQRQADLDSLKSRQKWLADQTSLSTITVHLDRTGDDADDDGESAGGFLGGLGEGWDSFVGGLVVAATALGFLLPWLVALGVIGVPLALWLRSRRGRRPAPAVGP